LLRNEYLVTEHRMLRTQIKGRVRLTNGERKTLAEIGHKLGKQALREVASLVKPDTMLAWHRKLVAQKFDGSQQRQAPGRPKIDQALEALIVRMAQDNRSWGDDRIVGALAHLGDTVRDQTVGNILKRHGIAPAPERKTTTTWKEFIRTHLDGLVATDFFTAEVWTLGGLVTYDVLFFIHLGSRQIHVAGVTPHPHQAWMRQIARNVTMEEWGFLSPGQSLIHDRDTKFCAAFQQIIDAAGVTRVPLPPRSPNLNAYAECSVNYSATSRRDSTIIAPVSVCHRVSYAERYSRYKGVVYYLRDGRVRGVLLWNVWEQVDAARRLIAEAGPFRPADLKGRLPA
jgi:transposase InsO family protein